MSLAENFHNCPDCQQLFHLKDVNELYKFATHKCEPVPCPETGAMPSECVCPEHMPREEDAADFPY